MAELSGVASTEAGMLAIWAPEEFAGIVDQPSWAAELGTEDGIRARIEAGGLVPINIGGNGAWQVVLRAGGPEAPGGGLGLSAPEMPGGGAGLSAREERYVMLSSEPYLLVCHGMVHVGGIEEVSGRPADTGLPLPPGRYSVSIHLIEWDAEPGSRDAQGQPTEDALPDFVVLLELDYRLGARVPPAGSALAPVYRRELLTFGAAG
ncbi:MULTISPECIES: hypothetical protein [unclassified Crossiella]|uniref:hypothetical protein n=1 Tax=unclassified Crossiella TaxID=2620835 RepID=UPI001FFE77C0|nr:MULTISPECIES: hypothetical protein [unclassified Crossiella]MCK2238896.1 hypothetical protein [Crossiella sp. S99.2]MCK2251534.1 hypothetical protein [Crossiella sp. S99.1]